MKKKAKTNKGRSYAPNKMHETAAKFTDPFLLDAGTNVGNHYRIKRAIIRLEQEDLDNQARIRELKAENSKLRTKLVRLHEQVSYTEELEQRFEHLSSIIMESRFTGNDSSEFEEEEEENISVQNNPKEFENEDI
ncbi:hypothetical protein M9Y10_045606 [Tritrichomonas musculus]|uniref:Uncharacterized protein n=1 Tax=Tritrichomonas musculus TaxID=1915356 RepID=A0ABR2JVR0_9EUKA